MLAPAQAGAVAIKSTASCAAIHVENIVSHNCTPKLDELSRNTQYCIYQGQNRVSAILKECINKKDLDTGKEVYSLIVKTGSESNNFLGSFLIRLFSLCGSLSEAHQVFSRLRNPDVFTWSAIILAHAKSGKDHKAINLYSLMLQHENIKLDAHACVAILKACSNNAAIIQGELIHSNIIEASLEVVLQVGNALIDMYMRSGSVEDAGKVFDRMVERDMVTWNTIISGYFLHRQSHKAFQCLEEMNEKGLEPDHITLLSVLKCTSCLEASNIAKSDCIFDTASMHHKLCGLQYAQELFDRLPCRTLELWSAMIAAYAEHGDGDRALHLYKEMQQEGLKPDNITFVCILKACSNIEQVRPIHADIVESCSQVDLHLSNNLIDIYGKYGSFEDANRLFDRLQKRCVVTWSALILRYAQHGKSDIALLIFYQMQHEWIQPNEVTFVSAVKACSNMTALVQGKLIHAYIIETGFDSYLSVGNTIIDMYSKCGSLVDACRVFVDVPKHSVVTWSVMIAAYAHHNNFELALQCFEDMLQEGLKPSDVTFVSVLTACCHLGLVTEGCQYFFDMERNYSMSPNHEHLNCIVELLGRAGHLKEAAELLQDMPLANNFVAWMSMLNQCKKHGDILLAQQCFDKIVSLNSHDASAYMLMSDLYTSAGMWEEANEIQKMRQCSMRSHKKLGEAFVEIDHRLYGFVAGDKSCMDSRDIYTKIKRLESQMNEEGRLPNFDMVGTV